MEPCHAWVWQFVSVLQTGSQQQGYYESTDLKDVNTFEFDFKALRAQIFSINEANLFFLST